MAEVKHDRRYVRPSAGLRVRDPDRGGVLPDGGGWVRWSAYWERQLQDGSVSVTIPPPDQASS
jgi:Protein of unknown function (DUF2635)